MQTHQTPAAAQEKNIIKPQLVTQRSDSASTTKIDALALSKIINFIEKEKYTDAEAILNNRTDPFTDINTLADWLIQAKIDFPKLFLSSSLGKIISGGKFPNDQSPILTLLEDHPRLDQIIRHSNFPPEQIGHALFKAVERNNKKLALLLLKSAAGPRYDEMENYKKEASTEYNETYGSTFAAYCDRETGNRPLHLVCAQKNLDDTLMSALIERGASLTDRNKAKTSPLTMLLDAKVDMNTFLTTHFPVLSAEHINKLILTFSMKKMFEPAKKLIRLADNCKMPLDLHYVDSASQNSILHYAVEQQDDMEFTKLVLLHSDKKSLFHENSKHENPLISAININNDAATKLIFTLSIKIFQDPDLKNGLIAMQKNTFLGNALLSLAQKDKIDLAIELLESHPDTRIDIMSSQTSHSIAHYAAESNHPHKLTLLAQLCGRGTDLEQKNSAGKSPLSILVERQETDIIAALFKDYSRKFSPNGMKLITLCLIVSKKDLSYLSIYLARMQENLTYDLATKQRETKELLFSLIDMAASQKDVENIISTFKAMEQAKKTDYLSQATHFLGSAPTYAKDILNRAQEKISSLALFQNPLIQASLNSDKPVAIKTLFSTVTKPDEKQTPAEQSLNGQSVAKKLT